MVKLQYHVFNANQTVKFKDLFEVSKELKADALSYRALCKKYYSK
jgi:hypothetical protein